MAHFTYTRNPENINLLHIVAGVFEVGFGFGFFFFQDFLCGFVVFCKIGVFLFGFFIYNVA